MFRFIRSKKGQGMTEYILIIAAIAVAAMGVLSGFKTELSTAFKDVGGAIGDQAEKSIEDSKTGTP